MGVVFKFELGVNEILRGNIVCVVFVCEKGVGYYIGLLSIFGLNIGVLKKGGFCVFGDVCIVLFGIILFVMMVMGFWIFFV